MNEEFKTSDFYVSVFCKTKGLKLLDIDKTNPRRAIFIFEDRDDRTELVDEFWSGKATVEPQAFIANIRDLKQRIFSDSYKSE